MPHSLAKRYIFKLLANLVAVPVYLIMEAILPRALGPQTYGNYNFATALFQQFSGFLDMGTSTCFYNALSRRQQETRLFAFYLRITAIILTLLGICGLLLLWPPVGAWIMPDTPLWFAPMAALWAFLTWLSRVLRSANDALGATVQAEMLRAALSVLAVLLLVGLFFTDTLNITTLFLQQFIFLGTICAASYLVSKRHWACSSCSLSWRLPPGVAREYASEFFNYSHPLFIQALLSFFMLSAERWLLQWFDGSAQQGFYALSQKVSMACFLFVSAMTPLLMREFSVAWGKGDRLAMGYLLSRFAPGLYAIAAYFSCFTLAEGKTIVAIFGGAQFAAAAVPVQIMALYPLHQAYGQMAGSVFHASGKTAVIRNLTACECVYGLATAWILLAPAELFGLNLGATGLAIKTVSVQFLSVNIYLWLASRMIPFAFWRNFFHQILIVLLFTALALISGALIDFYPIVTPLLRLLFAGLLYTFMIIVLTASFPNIIGLNYNEMKGLLHRVRQSINKGK